MGPAFGGGYDIVIYSDSHRTRLSHANFPHDYIDTTKKRNNTFTGAKVFMTNEIEVYSVLSRYIEERRGMEIAERRKKKEKKRMPRR